MDHRLIIGVTGPSHGIPWAWWATRWQLRRAGVVARRLNASYGYPGDDVAGFVIGGGNDVDPAIYGGDVSDSRSIDPSRDAYELEVLELAEKRRVPVMGICRGAQLINVHRGGTLVSDLSNVRVHTSNRGTLLPRKAVSITAGSTLAGLIGSESARVNSLHHQAVERTGDGLVVSALDRDEIVQAIESVEGPLRVGVQWHPEYMPQRPDQRRLFDGFVATCRG
jgi:putative glutamine amidotransferase